MMKKIIKVFSIVVIIVFVITPILSNIVASVSIKGYYGLIETDASIKLKTVIFSNILVLLNVIFNVLACVYLIKHSCEGEIYTLEILILSIRVVVLPLIGTVYSKLLTIYMSHSGTDAAQYFSIYSNYNNSFSFLQSIAGSLFIIALAFSISEKVHNKKQSSNEAADNIIRH